MKRGVCLIGCLLVMSTSLAKATYPFEGCFQVASRMHQVPLDLLLAVAATESNWDAAARSDANAHGIMQIQWPGTAKHLGVKRVSELYNPCLNIELGARYLRELLDGTGGDVQRALASYNYGPTRIAKVTELPAGAQGYVRTVKAHQTRILAGQQATPTISRKLGRAQTADLRFENGLRARRYAKSLQSRVQNAQFAAQRRADGTYSVNMQVGPGGLSLGDRRLLEQVGWPADLTAGAQGGG